MRSEEGIDSYGYSLIKFEFFQSRDPPSFTVASWVEPDGLIMWLFNTTSIYRMNESTGGSFKILSPLSSQGRGTSSRAQKMVT